MYFELHSKTFFSRKISFYRSSVMNKGLTKNACKVVEQSTSRSFLENDHFGMLDLVALVLPEKQEDNWSPHCCIAMLPYCHIATLPYCQVPSIYRNQEARKHLIDQSKQRILPINQSKNDSGSFLFSDTNDTCIVLSLLLWFVFCS